MSFPFNLNIPNSVEKFLEMESKDKMAFGGVAGWVWNSLLEVSNCHSFASLPYIVATAVIGAIAFNNLVGTDPIGRTTSLLGKFAVQEVIYPYQACIQYQEVTLYSPCAVS